MSSLRLSNLQVRPNLLSAGHYQQEMLRCSVFELRDIKERNPNLISAMPPSKQEEWRESLFWGKPPPPTDPGWVEHLAGGLSEEVRSLEERPTLEAALECLALARQLFHTRPDGPARALAAEWDRRVCVVLARDEFRLTPDMVDQRLESILGRRLPGPVRPDVPPPEPQARPVAVAAGLRQPVLFPAAVDTEAEFPLEPPATDVPGVSLPPAIPDGKAEHALAPPCVPMPPVTAESSPPAGLMSLAAEPPRAEAEPPRTAHTAAIPKQTVGSPPGPEGPPRPTTTLTIRDPDLKRLVQRWATLPDHVKKCVMMLLDAAEATKTTTE